MTTLPLLIWPVPLPAPAEPATLQLHNFLEWKRLRLQLERDRGAFPTILPSTMRSDPPTGLFYSLLFRPQK